MFPRRILSIFRGNGLLMVKGNNMQNYSSSIQSEPVKDTDDKKEKKISRAMIAYVERAKIYTEFIKKEEAVFNIGKRHLANMMGHDPETFTQEQIDEAIEYLFPSGLFAKRARPFMKPPHLVFPPKKDAEFDESGRPFHFLFYTGKPNFYNLLHDLVEEMEKLNKIENEITKSYGRQEQETLDVAGSEWVTKAELEHKLVEELKNYEYKNFISAMDRLLEHKHSVRAKEFILEHRKSLMVSSMSFEPAEPLIDDEGRRYVITKDCPRKSARADVVVKSPGSGFISINGQGIEYFKTMQARNQILFPLEFTSMGRKVDIEATVTGGGETGQAGAIRWGISWGLCSFVSAEMLETMRLAGLLTKDFRRRERKKPGQAKARRKYTWKKR